MKDKQNHMWHTSKILLMCILKYPRTDDSYQKCLYELPAVNMPNTVKRSFLEDCIFASNATS